jgi:dihydrofolate synthase / folylpolyglutamate synthase
VDYPGALAYLDEHINREATAGRIAGLSLEPIERLLAVLGDPQRAYPVIHVTGTNGKGSVGRMVSALLLAHNLTVGTYASPHLERVNERLLWNLQPIENEPFAALIAEVAELEPLSGVMPSYFELLTAAALSWFAEVAVDVAVVEVGLLGRWDATNVVDADVAVVTNIGQDHTDAVGDWRAAVAAEKAGIIKPDSFLVLGENDFDLLPIFEGEPHRGTWVAGEDVEVIDDLPAVGGRVIAVRTPHGVIDELFLPVHGRHQAENAALAVAAVEAFFDRGLDPDVAREAFAALTIPGRFEVVRRSPLVVVDAAHNPPGAMAAGETFVEDFTVSGRRTLVVGMLEGRDPGQMFEAFDVGAFDLVIACRAPSPRAIPADVLADAATALGATVEVVADVGDAVRRAMSVSTEDDAVLVAGSVYVTGAARAVLAG